MTNRTGRPRALVTLPDVAIPSDTGRRLRSLSTINGLARIYDLDVVITGRLDPAASHVQPLEAVERVLTVDVPRPPKARALLSALRAREPVELHNESWATARDELRRWPLHDTYDLVWFGAVSHRVGLGDVVRGRRHVVDYDDLQTTKWIRYLASTRRRVRTAPDRLRRRLEIAAWHRAERAIASEADAVVLSDAGDEARCAELGIVRPVVVPNSYPDPGRREWTPADPPVVAYVGNFEYEPNRLAVAELRTAVLPLLRRQHPGLTLRLIGAGSEELAAGADDGVNAVGRVAEVAPFLEGCAATLLPIRTGGGTRIKAMEAVAYGVPVVGTAFAVAGLGFEDGVHFRLADTPQEFAAAVDELLRDPAARSAMQAAARRHYDEHFTPEASASAIAALVERVAARDAAPSRAGTTA